MWALWVQLSAETAIAVGDARRQDKEVIAADALPTFHGAQRPTLILLGKGARVRLLALSGRLTGLPHNPRDRTQRAESSSFMRARTISFLVTVNSQS